MIAHLLLTLAAAAQPVSFPEHTAVYRNAVIARCERAALPLECYYSGEAAYYSASLVRRCIQGADDSRYADGTTNSLGYPTQDAANAACADARSACLENWQVFLARTRRSGSSAPSEEFVEKSAEERCSLEVPQVYD